MPDADRTQTYNQTINRVKCPATYEVTTKRGDDQEYGNRPQKAVEEAAEQQTIILELAGNENAKRAVGDNLPAEDQIVLFMMDDSPPLIAIRVCYAWPGEKRCVVRGREYSPAF
jgi:hypothetical protein